MGRDTSSYRLWGCRIFPLSRRLPGQGVSCERIEGEKYTGIRSVYFCLIRSASAFLFSNGCSSLNFDFMAEESETTSPDKAGEGLPS
jgi:hypothetical protein